MKLPDNLKNTSGFGKGLPPARYTKGNEGVYSLSFQNEFDHAVWYAAGTPKTPGGRSDKQKEVLAWLMSQGLTFEEIKEHRKKILDVIRKQVNTSIAKGSGDIDVPNVNPQFADKEEPEEDILGDLPGDLAASLAAFAAKKGATIPSETAEKAKKTSSYKSNTKLLGAITEKLSKIQGSLDAVAQSLDRQNALLQTNIQTNIAIVDSVVESNNILETKFDALLAAFNEQAVASQQYYENLERAGREYVQDQKRDVAGSVTPTDLSGGKGGSSVVLGETNKFLKDWIKKKLNKLVFGNTGLPGDKLPTDAKPKQIMRSRAAYWTKLGEKYPRLMKIKFFENLANPKFKLSIEQLGPVYLERLSQEAYKTSYTSLTEQQKTLINMVSNNNKLLEKKGVNRGSDISKFLDKTDGGRIKLPGRTTPRIPDEFDLDQLFKLSKAERTALGESRLDKLLSKNNIPPKARKFIINRIKKGETSSKFLRRFGTRGFIGSVARRLGPTASVLFSGIDYGERRAAGQTNRQAVAGVTASNLGGFVGGAIGAKAGAKTGALIGAFAGPKGAIVGGAIGGIIGGVAGAFGVGTASAKVADRVTGADQLEQGSGSIGPVADPAIMIGAAKSFVNQLGPMGEEVKVQFTPKIARLEKLFGAVDPNMESPVGGSIEGKQSPLNKKKTAGTIGDTESQDIDFDKVVPKGPLDDFLNFFKDTIKTVTDIVDKAKQGLNAVASEVQNLPSTIKNALNLGAGNPNAPGNVYSAVLPQGNPVFSSPFGPRWGRQHAGIDIGVDRGSPVTSLVDGEVTHILPKFGEYGGAVFVKGADGMETVYGHVNATVKVGQKVKKGETVATVTYYPGKDGSDQTHLHLERRPAGGGKGSQVNPLAFVQQKGQELIDKKENTVPEGSFGISEKGKQQAEANKKEAQELKLTTDIPFQAPQAPPPPSFAENPQYYVDKLLDNFNAKPPQQPDINEPSPIDFPESSMFDVIVPTPMMNNATPEQNQQTIIIPTSSNSVKQLNNLRLAQ